MSDVRKRVKALVERAAHASTPIEEARSAAVIACKLILEHKMLDSVAPSRPPKHNDFEGLINEMFRAAVAAQRTAKPKPAAPTPEQVEAKRKAAAERERTAQGWHKDGWKRLESRYDGRCRCCKSTYVVGDPVAWKPEHGAVHINCAGHFAGSECGQCKDSEHDVDEFDVYNTDSTNDDAPF